MEFLFQPVFLKTVAFAAAVAAAALFLLDGLSEWLGSDRRKTPGEKNGED